MSFTANYTLSQGTDFTGFTLTDTSTGTDTNLTSRQVLIYLSDGSYLTGAPITWNIAQSTLTLTGIMAKDYSLLIVVNWISSSPIGGSSYTKSQLFLFTNYLNAFLFNILQSVSANPNILNITDFYVNLQKLYTEKQNAAQAITYSIQVSAQQALDRAALIMNNTQLYFS
jgi:hypothetical protein